jgi:hypothetical protein
VRGYDARTDRFSLESHLSDTHVTDGVPL